MENLFTLSFLVRDGKEQLNQSRGSKLVGASPVLACTCSRV
jgi:hypothetical protein